MKQQQSSTKREWGNCGECLMNDVEVVKLGADGKCPRCGADYAAIEAADNERAEIHGTEAK